MMKKNTGLTFAGQFWQNWEHRSGDCSLPLAGGQKKANHLAITRIPQWFASSNVIPQSRYLGQKWSESEIPSVFNFVTMILWLGLSSTCLGCFSSSLLCRRWNANRWLAETIEQLSEKHGSIIWWKLGSQMRGAEKALAHHGRLVWLRNYGMGLC